MTTGSKNYNILFKNAQTYKNVALIYIKYPFNTDQHQPDAMKTFFFKKEKVLEMKTNVQYTMS